MNIAKWEWLKDWVPDHIEVRLVMGSDEQETISDTRANDFVRAGKGDDLLFTHGGNDLLFGGAGDDVFVSSNTDDFAVEGGKGMDILVIHGSEKGMKTFHPDDDTTVITGHGQTIIAHNVEHIFFQ